jgi:hypothetical protein
MKRARIRFGRIALAVVLLVAVAYPVALATFRERPRHGSLSTAEAFDAEGEDEAWARSMERQLRGLIAPAVAKLGGAQLVEVECRSRSCRLGVAVTAELKTRLNRGSPRGVGFAVDRILNEVGPIAPRRSAAWDDERSTFESVLAWLAFKEAEGAVKHWRLARLSQEQVIVTFDDRTRDVADQAAWNTSVLQKLRSRRG